MHIAILGFDREGRSSYDYFLAQGHRLTIHDQKTDIVVPAGVPSVLGDTYLDDLDRYDLLVRTAGLPAKLILAKNPGVADKITTQINEFFAVSRSKNIIGVTGTKGKGTTSTLIAQMLTACGKQVALGGNIGVPALDLLPSVTTDSWVVLELSSFQLSDFRAAPHIGVCLMMAPEHLNWHADLEDYVAAKANLFTHQTDQDIAIYYAPNETSKEIARHGAGQKIPYYAEPGAIVSDGTIWIAGQAICKTAELQLIGEHNWQNVCAALTAVWQISQDSTAIRSVLTSFSGLEHRLELVREVAGVRYYDDSFGTTPETAIVALRAFREPKIIILGGSDKGADYSQLATAIATSNVKKVIAIGQQAPRITAALSAVGFSSVEQGHTTMTDIVAAAQAASQAGDVVLLSPACASFDMFSDYKDRGNQFKTAVRSL